MLEGLFVTVTGFNHYWNKTPFPIGAVLLCRKEPQNSYDSEAIAVWMQGGRKAGYIANSTGTKANGTMSSARVYDRVGNCFLIEVCFSTQTKIICRVISPDVQDSEIISCFSSSNTENLEEKCGEEPDDCAAVKPN